MPRQNLLAFAQARRCDPLSLLKELHVSNQLGADFTFPEEYVATLEQKLELEPAELPGLIQEQPAVTSTGINVKEVSLRSAVRSLYKKGKFGGAHTNYKNFMRGIPDHLKGAIEEAMNVLVREGVIELKHTKSKDRHIRLNPAALPEIEAILDGRVNSPALRQTLGMPE